jgi:general secretion pathway protein E
MVMQADRLPFAFARDQQVILDGTRMIVGPDVTSLGLREAARRAGNAPLIKETVAGFETALSRVYNTGAAVADGDDTLFTLEDTGTSATRQRDLLDEAGEAPVIQLVNQLLLRALTAGASDLHIEPYEDGLRARMRVDGFLQKIMDRSDVPVRRVVSRRKVMAGLDIAETRLPQDGRIPLSLGGRTIDTRVSSLPGNYGERIVLRILDRSTGLMELSDLGLSTRQISLLERMSALPNGIILATGPTGAGKPPPR